MDEDAVCEMQVVAGIFWISLAINILSIGFGIPYQIYYGNPNPFIIPLGPCGFLTLLFGAIWLRLKFCRESGFPEDW
jgi:hypothetical protein